MLKLIWRIEGRERERDFWGVSSKIESEWAIEARDDCNGVHFGTNAHMGGSGCLYIDCVGVFDSGAPHQPSGQGEKIILQ